MRGPGKYGLAGGVSGISLQLGRRRRRHAVDEGEHGKRTGISQESLIIISILLRKRRSSPCTLSFSRVALDEPFALRSRKFMVLGGLMLSVIAFPAGNADPHSGTEHGEHAARTGWAALARARESRG